MSGDSSFNLGAQLSAMSFNQGGGGARMGGAMQVLPNIFFTANLETHFDLGAFGKLLAQIFPPGLQNLLQWGNPNGILMRILNALGLTQAAQQLQSRVGSMTAEGISPPSGTPHMGAGGGSGWTLD